MAVAPRAVYGEHALDVCGADIDAAVPDEQPADVLSLLGLGATRDDFEKTWAVSRTRRPVSTEVDLDSAKFGLGSATNWTVFGRVLTESDRDQICTTSANAVLDSTNTGLGSTDFGLGSNKSGLVKPNSG